MGSRPSAQKQEKEKGPMFGYTYLPVTAPFQIKYQHTFNCTLLPTGPGVWHNPSNTHGQQEY